MKAQWNCQRVVCDKKITNDATRHSFIDETGKIELNLISIDNTFQRLSGVHKLSSSSSSERTTVVTPAVRSRSLPGSRFPSPSRPVSRDSYRRENTLSEAAARAEVELGVK
ncbi:hypothetical protein Nepgr_004097 [Nepenthes gracilis]|uniref:Uncharacterized protein n=1 Tax=Nepenthes gracilis TaxID=150966 RepID=A0AAD3S0Q5_NEPGR|nr:hypothetical protein Nepgr_004097 [Nepenthes gracilis]